VPKLGKRARKLKGKNFIDMEADESDMDDD